MNIVLIVVLAIIIALVAWLVAIYNGLVQLRNQVDNSWSQIDVQLKRRHDLIPNLVETTKGYMQQERGTFEAVTNARSQALGAKSIAEASKAESALTQALGKFMLVVENYPELKANQNFLSLQEELSATENRIAFSRQAYNDSVLFYNNRSQMFPSNIVASSFNFTKRDFFQIEDEQQRQVPKVSF